MITLFCQVQEFFTLSGQRHPSPIQPDSLKAFLQGPNRWYQQPSPQLQCQPLVAQKFKIQAESPWLTHINVLCQSPKISTGNEETSQSAEILINPSSSNCFHQFPHETQSVSKSLPVQSNLRFSRHYSTLEALWFPQCYAKRKTTGRRRFTKT